MLLSAIVACVAAASPCDAQMLEQGSSESRGPAVPPPEPRAVPALPAPTLTLTVRPLAVKEPKPDRAPPQAYCVRLCDGYYFPISAAGDSAGGEKNLCTALCPGARTDLYRRAAGEAMDEATAPNRKPYKSLATAFAYRTSLSPQCSCQAAAGLSALALTNDVTLRSGDIVVTPKGVRVFAGSPKFPFRESDFVDFRVKGRVPRPLLTYLSVIDKPFRFATPAATAPKPERVSTADETQHPLVKRR
jgi:hypothetical protein